MVEPNLGNVIVTGGAGFIGSNLIKHLEDKITGTIFAIDTFGESVKSCKTHGTFENISDLECLPIPCDIRFIKQKLIDIIDKPIDAIFHLAAISDTIALDQNTVIDVNMNSLHQILELCDYFSAPLIYASSGSVYGNKPNHSNYLGSECPNSVYGYSKFSMDKFSSSINFKTKGGQHITGIRFFNVYGPREKNKGKASSMIWQLYNQLKSNKVCNLFEESNKIVRDFVYVEDVSKGIFAALNTKPGIYNLGTGNCRSFLDVANIISNYLGLGETANVNYISNPYKDRYQFKTLAPWDETNILYEAKINPYTLEQGIKKYLRNIEES